MEYNIMILSGGFDPVHVGHVRMFRAAKELANTVIVGVNSDNWLVRKKGKSFMCLKERIEIINAMKDVDMALVFDDADNTAIDLINKIALLNKSRISIAFGNGGDRTKDNVPEQEICNKLQVELVWGVGGADKVQSSSKLINDAIIKPTKNRKCLGGSVYGDICTACGETYNCDGRHP